VSAAAIALLELGIKYVPELVTEIIGAFHKGATIDDAIAALEAAKKKTAADYLAEAAGPPVVPPA
jgi:hypothetical protein